MEALFLKILNMSVKNVLRFKSPKKQVIVLTVILCIAVLVSCAANPVKNTRAKANDQFYGNYVFEKQIYMNPLSSFMAFDGYREYYTLAENLLMLTDENGNQQRNTVAYEQTKVDEQEFKNSFMFSIEGIPDLSAYKERYQYTLTDASGSALYRIYQLDDEMWLARMNKVTSSTQKREYFWYIYKIARLDIEIPMRTTISGTQEGIQDFLLYSFERRPACRQ